MGEEAARLTYKEQYFNYLAGYLKKKQQFYGLMAPSTARIEDQLLHKLVTDVASLSLELQELRVSVQDGSSVLLRKRSELDALKQSLTENGVRIEKAAVNEELAIVNEKIASLLGN